MEVNYSNCEEVSALCPIEGTIYGYRPNLGGNVFFLVGFSLLFVSQTYLGIRYKTWPWLFALFTGLILEVVGYAGRIMLYQNPWDSMGLRIQLACLIIAPSLISGSIDLVLKHVVRTLGSKYSRIPANYYAWLFIGADVFSIGLQAIGGGLASNTGNPTLFSTGNNLMLAGIILQVAQLVLFAIVSAEYGYRTYVHRHETSEYHALGAERRRKLKLFLIACTIAFVAILARCCYRIPELAQGWGGELMRDEPTFLILDGAMVFIAALVLTTFHPGIFFPEMSKGSARKASQAHSHVAGEMAQV